MRADANRIYMIRFLVIAPVDTPYSNGCFEFEMVIGNNYPNGPPRVQLLTTGRGSFRFNPNLYDNGKVCLSLLGTWAGPGWDPQSSTLLQILVSIQSLILVPDPYFNEPGYAHQQVRLLILYPFPPFNPPPFYSFSSLSFPCREHSKELKHQLNTITMLN